MAAKKRGYFTVSRLKPTIELKAVRQTAKLGKCPFCGKGVTVTALTKGSDNRLKVVMRCKSCRHLMRVTFAPGK